MVFMILIYIHLTGCLWYAVMNSNQDYKPHDRFDMDADFYTSTDFWNLYA